MSKYVMHESFDLGESYIPTTFEDNLETLEELGKTFNKIGDRRWVITEGEDKPIRWCIYVTSFLEMVDKHPDGVIATEDEFARKILESRGIKAITAAEAFKKMTGKEPPEGKRFKDMTPEEKKTMVSKIIEAQEKGVFKNG